MTELTSNAEYIGYGTFYWSDIQVANFPNAYEIQQWGFYSSQLVTGYFPEVTDTWAETFYDCYKLESIYIPKLTALSEADFGNCQRLQRIDLHDCKSFSKRAFKNCRSLKAVILRKEKVCYLGNNANPFDGCAHILGQVDSSYNPNGDKDGYIYVPSSVLSGYESHSNWSAYAGQFRALENYTVDGTITGELDESKI